MIFDFDGLMFDTESFYMAALDKVVSHYGKTMNPQAVRNQMGISGKRMIEVLREDLNITDSLENLMLVVRRYFDEIDQALIEPMPGLIELTEYLKSQKIQLAICSSNRTRTIKRLLKLNAMENSFSVIVSADDVENRKPDPEPYLKTLEKMGLKAEDCLALEDSSVGVEAAIAAGLDCVAIPTKWTNTMDFSRATVMATTLTDPVVMDFFN